MTPGLDWRARYARRPALAKLEYCDRAMADLRGREPLVTAEDPDEDVGGLDLTLDEFYRAGASPESDALADLDGALAAIFGDPAGSTDLRLAATLIRRMERDVAANVYHWTGWFPERRASLLRQLADRAEQQQLRYPRIA